MGKRAIIKDTPSSSEEAAVLPTPVSEPDATVTPKMALAGGGPGKVEMAKIETLGVPGIEVAEIKTETSTARKHRGFAACAANRRTHACGGGRGRARR
jgi:hypothetical protein